MLGQHVNQWDLEDLVCKFLFYQANPGETVLSLIPSIHWLTTSVSHLLVFHSADAIFHAPNNLSGTSSMYHETICSTPQWKSGGTIGPHCDCVFLDNGSDKLGARSVDVARVHLFFSFELEKQVYPCALVQDFHMTFTEPDPDNGMRVVKPTFNTNGSRSMSIVHVDLIVRTTHLLPIFQASSTLPPQLTFCQTLDSFRAFYINKYINYYVFKTVF